MGTPLTVEGAAIKAPLRTILARAEGWEARADKLEMIAKNLRGRARRLKECVEAIRTASEDRT